MNEFIFDALDDDAIKIMEEMERESKMLNDGPGRWELLSRSSVVSQNTGRPMLKLNMKVWDCNGKSAFITDYLIFERTSFFLKKVKSFCESAGLEEIYKSGKISEDDISPGLTGDLVLSRRMYKGEPQNSIKEYCKGNDFDSNSSKKNINQINNNAPFLNDSLDDIAF
jgi:hypothetical protein